MDVKIVNRLGLHARAAARLVALASEFQSEVWLVRGAKKVDATSIMAVMMLAAGQGAELQLQAEGADEDEAVERLGHLIRERFGESE